MKIRRNRHYRNLVFKLLSRVTCRKSVARATKENLYHFWASGDVTEEECAIRKTDRISLLAVWLFVHFVFEMHFLYIAGLVLCVLLILSKVYTESGKMSFLFFKEESK